MNLKLSVADLRRKLAHIALGGGEKRIEKLHSQGKMTARERIEYVLDKDKNSIEIGAFAGEGMYQEHGGCPSGGVVVKIGYINNKETIKNIKLLRAKENKLSNSNEK